MNFKEELKRRTEEAEHVIREYLPEESGFAKTMAEAMNYSMMVSLHWITMITEGEG